MKHRNNAQKWRKNAKSDKSPKSASEAAQFRSRWTEYSPTPFSNSSPEWTRINSGKALSVLECFMATKSRQLSLETTSSPHFPSFCRARHSCRCPADHPWTSEVLADPKDRLLWSVTSFTSGNTLREPKANEGQTQKRRQEGGFESQTMNKNYDSRV